MMTRALLVSARRAVSWGGTVGTATFTRFVLDRPANTPATHAGAQLGWGQPLPAHPSATSPPPAGLRDSGLRCGQQVRPAKGRRVRAHAFHAVTAAQHAPRACSAASPPPLRPRAPRQRAPTLRLGGGCLLGAGDAVPVQLPADPCLAVKPADRAEGLRAHGPARPAPEGEVVYLPRASAPAGWGAQSRRSPRRRWTRSPSSRLSPLWPRIDTTRTASPGPTPAKAGDSHSELQEAGTPQPTAAPGTRLTNQSPELLLCPAPTARPQAVCSPWACRRLPPRSTPRFGNSSNPPPEARSVPLFGDHQLQWSRAAHLPGLSHPGAHRNRSAGKEFPSPLAHGSLQAPLSGAPRGPPDGSGLHAVGSALGAAAPGHQGSSDTRCSGRPQTQPPVRPRARLEPGPASSPRQALPADRVARRRAVGLLDTVDEGAGEAGLAAVVPPAVLELPGRAGDAPRIPAAAVATVLQDTSAGARLRQGPAPRPMAAPRARPPFSGGKGWRGCHHVKGPQNPAESRRHRSSSDEGGPRGAVCCPAGARWPRFGRRGAPAASCCRRHRSGSPAGCPGGEHQSHRPGWASLLQPCPARAHSACSLAGQRGCTRTMDQEETGISIGKKERGHPEPLPARSLPSPRPPTQGEGSCSPSLPTASQPFPAHRDPRPPFRREAGRGFPSHCKSIGARWFPVLPEQPTYLGKLLPGHAVSAGGAFPVLIQVLALLAVHRGRRGAGSLGRRGAEGREVTASPNTS